MALVPEEKRPVFSVVVPTYRRPPELVRLLEAICRFDYPAGRFEVIVVDDSGEASLGSVVEPFARRLSIRLLSSPHLGPAPARQLGIDIARGEYLAFTDDDCIPQPDWLTRLEHTLRSHPGDAAGGPVDNALTRNPYSSATQTIVNYLTDYSNKHEVRYLGTANIAFPSTEFSAMGGLDRNWHLWGGEDRDLARRWTEAGHRIHCNAAARVDHYHHLNLGSFWRQHFRYGQGACRLRLSQKLSRAGFYAGLVRAALRHRPRLMVVRVLPLVALAQVAGAAGFLSACWTWRRESKYVKASLPT